MVESSSDPGDHDSKSPGEKLPPGQVKGHLLRNLVVILVLFLSLVGVSGYQTMQGFHRGSAQVDSDPHINIETETLALWVDLENKGIFSITLEITVNITDLRHQSHIGTATGNFEIRGRSRVNKTLVMAINTEFVEYSKGENGLHIEIQPSVTGTYAGFFPIPEFELETKKLIIYN